MCGVGGVTGSGAATAVENSAVGIYPSAASGIYYVDSEVAAGTCKRDT